MNKTMTVNNSSRPKNIPRHMSHLAESGKGEKVPVGPIISPNPGPTFEIEVKAPDMAVKKSNPTKESPTASTAKITPKISLI